MDDFWSSYDWAGMAQKVVIALLILIATWILARVVKWAIGKLVGKIKALQRQGNDGQSLGESIGQIASLLVWLFGLVAVLQVFALRDVLTPIQGMLDAILQYVPNIIGAGFVFFIGYVIAKIVRQLVVTGLNAVDLDGLMRRVSPETAADAITGDRARAGQPLAAEPGAPTGATAVQPSTGAKVTSIIGNLVFAIILIVVSIAALQILGIAAISDPAVSMLNTILNTIPAIIAAAVILGIGYLIAKFAGDLLESTLQGMGTDRAIASMGIVPEGRSASSVITTIVKVGIMLFFGIMAARALNFPEITEILNEVLELGGRVLFGGAIIAAGFLVAKLVSNAIGDGTASTVIRYAILVLFAAMGLQYMGIADSIINLAFGAVVVGGALAAALAYGLGGRDAAARSLERMREKADTSSDTPPL
ncbi:mechanosensitive ion channel [Ornithinimicrobium cavernae]|uniref:mechanosensitive ion channel n=1 Tax=Ornithinimicrobium cavernae TaxID=2666047 RepID=UPI000D686E53|nr:mechanosensitive ion channel [Ornithinimicrobium cavernae]